MVGKRQFPLSLLLLEMLFVSLAVAAIRAPLVPRIVIGSIGLAGAYAIPLGYLWDGWKGIARLGVCIFGFCLVYAFWVMILRLV